MTDKPNIHELEGAANVAAAIYLEGHYRAVQRLRAQDFMGKDPENYPDFETALAKVKASGDKSIPTEERECMKRQGHFSLMRMGAFGDLSEADIP